MYKDVNQIESMVTKLIEEQYLNFSTIGKTVIQSDMIINLKIAEKIAQYAREKAIELGVNVVISVVDNSGNLVLLHRMDNSLLASIELSSNKAYTAVSLKMSTDKLKELCKEGGELYGIQNTNSRFVIFGGGMPFIYNGKLIGAVGISGGSVEEDKCICEYALRKVIESL